MKKIALIIKREYFIRVKKKSFLLTTIGVPLFIIGFYAIIIAISMDSFGGGDDKNKIAVIDEGQLFDGKIENANPNIVYSIIKNETESNYIKKYQKAGFDAFLFIPNDSVAKTKSIYNLHSNTSMNLPLMSSIEETINEATKKKTLIANGINPEAFQKMIHPVELENTVDTETGQKKSFADVAYGVSFACGILIYMMMLIYGTQVMRGVTEEKTNRIAEVMVSSVKPFQMMMGKIIGIGAVGLTQFAVWIFLMFLMQMAIPLVFPDMMHQINNASTANSENISMASNIMQGLSSLHLGKILFSFLFYFLGGYLTYASIFAAIGSVVSEDQQEAQQLVFPVMMPIILGFVIMTKAVNEPNSSLAVFGSIFPLTSPIVMMGRIAYDIPNWQIAVSMLCLICSFLFFTWIAGKIYRTGILLYGKKPSWKEMIKWAVKKS